MILEGNFYTIRNKVVEDKGISAIIEINAGHEIFAGHFPGQPVVPGVCMVQIIKELIEMAAAKTLRLKNGQDLRFLAVIDPGKNSMVQAEASYTINASGEIAVTARLFFNEIVFFKFRGLFTEA